MDRQLICRKKGYVVIRPDRREIGLQPVVVALRNGIVLVVVAARAAEIQAEERGAYCICDVIEYLLPAEPQIAGVALIGPVPAEAGGDLSVGISGVELIARDLLLYEAVVRL